MPLLPEYRKSKANGSKANGARIAPKLIEVTFSLDRPGAQEVYLCGEVNQWSAVSLRMIRHGASEHWEKRLTLAPGRHQYKFVVDGEWIHDPEAAENVPNQHGSLNSIMEVHS